jgi:hypothetical protein
VPEVFIVSIPCFVRRRDAIDVFLEPPIEKAIEFRVEADTPTEAADTVQALLHEVFSISGAYEPTEGGGGVDVDGGGRAPS